MAYIPTKFVRGDLAAVAETVEDYWQYLWEGWHPVGTGAPLPPRNVISAKLADIDALEARLSSTLSGRWKPNVSYAAGDAVIAPDGSLVKAKAAFTSGASYVAANWSSVAATPGTQAKADLDAAYAAKASEATATDAQTRVGALEGLTLGGYASNVRPLAAAPVGPYFAGHGWGAGGSSMTSSNLNDTTTYLLGDRSAQLVLSGTLGAGGFANVDKSAMPAIDFTGRNVRVTARVDDVTKLRQWTLYMGTDSSNYYNTDIFTFPSGSDNVDLVRSGEWVTMDIPRSAFATGGTPPAWSNITFVRLLSRDRGTGTGTVTVWLSGVAPVAESNLYPNGVITLSFDDTYVGQYTNARPIMDKYGYVGTLYPIIGSIGQAGSWSLAQGLAMQASGWDFGAHALSGATHAQGMTGLYATSETTLRSEMAQIKAFMRANNLRGDSVAYPLNYFDLNVERIMGDYWRSARASGPAHLPETFPPRNPYRLRSLNVNAGVTANKAYVDKVKSSRAWGIFTLHDIVASGASGNNILTADFQTLVDYIASQGVAVRTTSQIMASIPNA